jgi:hypothetical protein
LYVRSCLPGSAHAPQAGTLHLESLSPDHVAKLVAGMSHSCIGEVAPNVSRSRRSHWGLVLFILLLVTGLLIGGWHLSGLAESIHSVAKQL